MRLTGRGASYDAPLGQFGSTAGFAGGRVAAMPSFGLKHKLGVAILAAAMFALSATAASAKEAWIWACHGPNGGSIATPMKPELKSDGAVTVNCTGDDATGATLQLNGANPAGGSDATLRIPPPGEATVKRIVITQAVHGSSGGARYRVGLGIPGSLLDQPLDAPASNLKSD